MLPKTLSTLIRPLAKFSNQVTKTQNKPILTRFRLAMGFAFGFTYAGYHQGQKRYRQMHFSSMYETLPDTEILTQEYFGEKHDPKRTFFQRFIGFIRRQIRLLHLLIKFMPVVITLPVALFFQKYLFQYWLDFLLYTLQSAGPLWIKLGQWASHRGDIFGEDIIKSLENLRDKAPPHSAKESHKQFELSFGKKIYDVFEFFNDQPIASGSIAQVHKARLNCENVAVKVRHPDIIENLEMDIRILYNWSIILSKTVLKSAAMPLTLDEFKRTLVSQTDLRLEAKNLLLFNEKFENYPHVVFPKPLPQYNSSSVLVESFEEGIPLQRFLDSKRTVEHQKIANLGLKAFYKMLIYDNFIHADCHAGNIFVRVQESKHDKEKDNLWHQGVQWFQDLQDKIFNTIESGIEISLSRYAEWQLSRHPPHSQKLLEHDTKKQYEMLHKEKKDDEKEYTQFIQEAGQTRDIEIILLDPGMVTILNKNDRAAFLKLVMYITLRKPIECGHLMLQLAQYNNIHIETKVKEKYIEEMKELFGELCDVPLSKMNIGLVLRSMLDILRQNGMSIEGHFAALLTNMIVLEGVVKQLDPDINIVAKAASFLLHLRTIDKTIDEIIQQAL